MSDAYARAGDEIRTQIQDPVEVKLITNMILDKTYYEIMDALHRDRVNWYVDGTRAWRNLEKQHMDFFAEYRVRQYEISSRTSESEDPLAPEPPINSQPATQTVSSILRPSDLEPDSSLNASTMHNDTRADIPDSNATGANTCQNLSGATIVDSGSSISRAADANSQARVQQHQANYEIIEISSDDNDELEHNTSFNVATTPGANTCQNLSGAGSSISRAADANSQARVQQHQGNSEVIEISSDDSDQDGTRS